MTNQLNITVGSDVILNVTLVHEEEVLIPSLIDNLEANLISGLGKRTVLETGLGADYITIAIPWVEGRLAGCYSLEVKGSINGLSWAAIGKGLILYTNATEAGADSVTVEADAYDVTMEAGYHYTDSPIAAVHVSVDDEYGTPSADVTYRQRVLGLDFHNLRGNGITEIDVDEQVGDEAVNTITIKTDKDPEGTELQVRNGSRGNGIASSSEELSPEDGGTNTFTFVDDDGTEHELHTKNGTKGIKGDSVLVGQGDLPLVHELGQSYEKAMSQKGVTDAFGELSVATSDESDLDIADEDGYSIVRFQNGHIKTKNFDSEHIEIDDAAMTEASIESSDLDIVDENDYSIVRFQNGHIKTKNFDSETLNLNTFDSSSKSIIATEETLEDGDSMSITNPDIKTHYMLSFTASLETMGNLSILVGSANVYSKGRVDVTPTEIVTYDWGTWDTHTYQHGLTFEDNISIAIKVKGVRKADLIIMTSNGENVYTKEIPWEGCSSGCTISNTGGSYEDCTFTANYYGVLKDVWFFGDSYLDRWARILEIMGFSNYLLDGFSGRASAAALTSFQKDVLIGKPKVVVWMMGMNDADSGSVNSAWKTAFDSVAAYCNANDIEFICCTIPNVPSINHTYKNAYINNSGVRVIDIAAELGATEANSTWYPGLLGTDNVHPTDSGAMRIALALLSNLACLTK